MSRFFKDIGQDLEELASTTKSKRLSWDGESSSGKSSDTAPPEHVFGGAIGGNSPQTPSDKGIGELGRSTPMSARTDDTTDSMLSLTDINDELHEIIARVNKGEEFDEKRLDYLIALQSDHPEHQMNLERENQEWLASVEDYLAESLAKTRSFLPVNISELGTKEKVAEVSNVSEDVAKRILERKCLWLCRMAPADIHKIHIVDMKNKYNPLGVNLDIVETAAVFACLPVTFQSDNDGKKAAFRDDIIHTLKDMISDENAGRLAAVRTRHPCYQTCSGEDDYGPVEDITSVMVNRRASIRAADFDSTPRRSFTEVCKRHSILSKHKEASVELENGDDSGDDSDSDGDGGEEGRQRRDSTKANTANNGMVSSSPSPAKEKKEAGATKSSTNIYVVYSGDDLVYFGWIRRAIHNETTHTTTFTEFFTVCTRNDSYLRLFKNEADVEEVGVVNLNLVLECSKRDEAMDGRGAGLNDNQPWRDSDSGGGEEEGGAKGTGSAMFRFVLTEVSGKEHIFACASAMDRDVWVERLTPVLKSGENH